MLCLHDDCEKPGLAKNMCGAHYRAWKRKNEPGLRAKEVERTRLWKLNNKEKHAAQQARKHSIYKEKNNVYTAQWKRDNWDTYKAYLYARKQRVKQATPRWADLEAIEKFYYECPKGYHVDHIIPINGRDVSGLHTIENLQYLLAIDNLRKSNK